LLLVNALRVSGAAAKRGRRTFREDLLGLAMGSALVVALVAATRGSWRCDGLTLGPRRCNILRRA